MHINEKHNSSDHKIKLTKIFILIYNQFIHIKWTRDLGFNCSKTWEGQIQSVRGNLTRFFVEILLCMSSFSLNDVSLCGVNEVCGVMYLQILFLCSD